MPILFGIDYEKNLREVTCQADLCRTILRIVKEYLRVELINILRIKRLRSELCNSYNNNNNNNKNNNNNNNKKRKKKKEKKSLTNYLVQKLEYNVFEIFLILF